MEISVEKIKEIYEEGTPTRYFLIGEMVLTSYNWKEYPYNPIYIAQVISPRTIRIKSGQNNSKSFHHTMRILGRVGEQISKMGPNEERIFFDNEIREFRDEFIEYIGNLNG